MAQNSLLTVLAAVVFCLAGFAMMASSFHVVRDGLRLIASDETVVATVTEKQIERPARKFGVRGESISVNGTKVRSLRTYFNSYFAIVYSQTGSTDTMRASVSYDDWHSLKVGTALEITVAPNVTEFADISHGATMGYGLKQVGIGFAIILLGVAVLFLPGKEQDEKSYSRYS